MEPRGGPRSHEPGSSWAELQQAVTKAEAAEAPFVKYDDITKDRKLKILLARFLVYFHHHGIG